MRINDECLIYLTPTLRIGFPNSQTVLCWRVSHLDDLMGVSMQPGFAANNRLPPQTLSAPRFHFAQWFVVDSAPTPANERDERGRLAALGRFAGLARLL